MIIQNDQTVMNMYGLFWDMNLL